MNETYLVAFSIIATIAVIIGAILEVRHKTKEADKTISMIDVFKYVDLMCSSVHTALSKLNFDVKTYNSSELYRLDIQDAVSGIIVDVIKANCPYVGEVDDKVLKQLINIVLGRTIAEYLNNKMVEETNKLKAKLEAPKLDVKEDELNTVSVKLGDR